GHRTCMTAGFMLMQAVPKDDATKEKIQEVVLAEIKKIADKGPTDAEMAKAVNGQLMGVIGQLSTNAGRAQLVATGAAFYGDPKYAISQLEAFRKVTKQDIQRVAKQYVTDNWVFYGGAPEKE